MLTQLKNKDLLKIINPFQDGIIFGNEELTLDLNEIKKLVENPNENLLENTENTKENIYRKIALAILNFNELEYSIIDLSKNNPKNIFDNGTLHFISSVYLNKEYTYIEIKDNEIGQQFIKSKKINEIIDPNIIPSKDFIFNNLNFENEILLKDFINWTKGTEEPQKDLSFYINELASCLIYSNSKNRNHYGSKELAEENDKFLNVFNQIPKEISLSKDFIEGCLTNFSLGKKFFDFYIYDNKPFIDFQSEIFKNKIFSDIENGNLTWARHIFKYSTQEFYNSSHDKINFNYFTEMLHHPKLIEILREKAKRSDFSFSSDELEMSNLYSYLPIEEQLKKENIKAHLISSSREGSSRGEYYISDHKILEIPKEAFYDMEIFKNVVPYIEPDKLKKHMLPPKTFKISQQDILQIIPKMAAWKFDNLMEHFAKHIEIGNNFAEECLKVNRSLYESKFFNKEYKKLDFLIFLHDTLNIEYKRIPNKNIIPHLFKENLTKEEDLFLTSYVIATKFNLENVKKLTYFSEEEKQKFIDKYQKLEYCFFKTDDWGHWRDDFVKKLKKIKEPTEFQKFLEQTKAAQKIYGFNVDYKSIFSSMNTKIKNNPDTLLYFLINFNADPKSINLKEECPQFLFNKSNSLKLLDIDPYYAKYIPKGLYSDLDFALSYAKKLDEGKHFEYAPVHIKKFFEHNEVKNNYYDYLKTFIDYNNLQSTLKQEPSTIVAKKKTKI